MQRVLVIGSPGAGKSTFARARGETTGLPTIHVDQLYWQAGWVQTPTDIYLEKLKTAIAGDRWIFDGTNVATFDLRVPRADTIIWLHRSRATCLWRIARRILTSYGQVRPDLAPGCPEKFDWEFIKWVWNFQRTYEPRIHASLDRHDAWGRTVVLRSDAEADAFLRGDWCRQESAPTPSVA